MTDKSTRGGFIPTPTFPVIVMGGRHSIGGGAFRALVNAAAASGANPFASGDMLCFPFTVNAPTTVYKGFWVNGASVGNNTAIAIYDASFTKMAQTSSTANSGASVPQVASFSPSVKLAPGMYYAAMAHDSATTGRYFRWSTNANTWKAMGCWRVAGTTLATLPSPATPVACNNVAFPVFGLITRSVFDV